MNEKYSEEFKNMLSEMIASAESEIIAPIVRRILIRDLIIWSIYDEVCSECKEKALKLIDDYFENEEEKVDAFIEYVKREVLEEKHVHEGV